MPDQDFESGACSKASISDSDQSDSDSGLSSAHHVTRQSLATVDPLKKGKKAKPVWSVLAGGSLFWYSSHALDKLKGDVKMQGTCVQMISGGKDAYSLCIAKGEKQIVILSFKDAVMRDEWLCDLKTSTALPPAEPPMRGKTRQKMSLGTRAQRNIAGRVGVTTFGKAMGKAAANEEVNHLIASVKNLILAVHDSKTANRVENNIIKLVIKYHFLMTHGVIEETAWLTMDEGLRKAF